MIPLAVMFARMVENQSQIDPPVITRLFNELVNMGPDARRARAGMPALGGNRAASEGDPGFDMRDKPRMSLDSTPFAPGSHEHAAALRNLKLPLSHREGTTPGWHGITGDLDIAHTTRGPDADPLATMVSTGTLGAGAGAATTGAIRALGAGAKTADIAGGAVGGGVGSKTAGGDFAPGAALGGVMSTMLSVMPRRVNSAKPSRSAIAAAGRRAVDDPTAPTGQALKEQVLTAGERDALLKWFRYDVEPGGQAEVLRLLPDMAYGTRHRALTKLSTSTESRVVANGEREFKLYRGVGNDPYEGTPHARQPQESQRVTSWTPRKAVAKDFAESLYGPVWRDGKLLPPKILERWVPESEIKSVPFEWMEGETSVRRATRAGGDISGPGKAVDTVDGIRDKYSGIDEVLVNPPGIKSSGHGTEKPTLPPEQQGPEPPLDRNILARLFEAMK